ncbi:MAG: sensor histidine kinase [Clostridiales bacterium]|nr:sensor histidine kinase [Clostridiales bacterium]
MIKDYLKSRLKVIILLMTAVLIFASSYLLFDMPVVTVLYPVILCFAFLLLIGIIDFLITLGKHKQLQMREMPAPSGILEKDYQKIILKLKEEEELSRKKANEDFNNMVEYYTVWAHQIKTPIASMRLQLQSEDTDVARRLNGDLNRIEEYVGMVLTFLRLDSDSTDYVIKEIDLDKVIKPVIRKFARDFISKKLSMDYETLETKVLSDEKWLSFVIEQVISNAVKYTKTGGIRIYMKEAGILCIEDTGIGISAEDLPRVFENGYTGFNGREDKRASGIGLYLCKRVCDNLGHKISAESAQGVGTKIMIDLNQHQLGIE